MAHYPSESTSLQLNDQQQIPIDVYQSGYHNANLHYKLNTVSPSGVRLFNSREEALGFLSNAKLQSNKQCYIFTLTFKNTDTAKNSKNLSAAHAGDIFI